MNENPLPLTFSPSYSAEKWSAIAALLDDLAPPVLETEDAEALALGRTQPEHS